MGFAGGTTLYRIQYVSLGANNEPVPATAFVAFPFTFPNPREPFKMVALAHGTIGTHYGCGPSASFNLYDYDTWRPIFLAGYAIVATDYAGLGNNYTQHYWEANTLNGNDVYFSAIAAKRAFPRWLSNEWVAVGHSQGGGAVWALAESSLVGEESPCADMAMKFLGSAALEPAVRFADEVAYSLEASQSDPALAGSLGAYSSYVYAALDAFEPGSADVGGWTAAMVQRVELGQALGGCFYVEASLVSDLVTAQGTSAIIANVTSITSQLLRYQATYGAGIGKKAQAPMLVVQSTADLTVPYPVIENAWETICSAGGEPVHFSVYPAIDHSPSLGASGPEVLKWIGDRFAGVDLPKNCTATRYKAVDKTAAYLPSDF